MAGLHSVDGDDLSRRPEEEWREYMNRLEQAHLRSVGEHRLKEAEALEKVAAQSETAEDDAGEEAVRTSRILKVEARAKRRYAQEFFDAIDEMERGAGS